MDIIGVENLSLVGVGLRLITWCLVLLPLIPTTSKYFFKFNERKPRMYSLDELSMKLVEKIPGLSIEMAEGIFMGIRFLIIVILFILMQALIGVVFIQ